jgi:hypothetical protein
VPHDPLRSVVRDTGFVTEPRRGRALISTVTYPDVFGRACKLKVLEPLPILSDGGSWSLYELYAALVTGPLIRASGRVYVMMPSSHVLRGEDFERNDHLGQLILALRLAGMPGHQVDGPVGQQPDGM